MRCAVGEMCIDSPMTYLATHVYTNTSLICTDPKNVCVCATSMYYYIFHIDVTVPGTLSIFN